MDGGDSIGEQIRAPIETAETVSQLIEDTATLQRHALEKQIQQ